MTLLSALFLRLLLTKLDTLVAYVEVFQKGIVLQLRQGTISISGINNEWWQQVCASSIGSEAAAEAALSGDEWRWRQHGVSQASHP